METEVATLVKVMQDKTQIARNFERDYNDEKARADELQRQLAIQTARLSELEADMTAMSLTQQHQSLNATSSKIRVPIGRSKRVWNSAHSHTPQRKPQQQPLVSAVSPVQSGAAPIELAYADKEGFLKRREGLLFRKWREMWCVLKGSQLYYFVDKVSAEPSGCIDLDECAILKDAREHTGTPNTFAIIDPKTNQETFFQCNSSSDVKSWIAQMAIRKSSAANNEATK